jgi:hypothetical protein
MKRRNLFLFALALALLVFACKRTPSPAPSVTPPPAPEVAPAPNPAPDLVVAVPDVSTPTEFAPPPGDATPPQDPWAEYVFMGPLKANEVGPPSPPVGKNETVTVEDLAKGWTQVPIARGENDPAPDIDTPDAAALAIETLNNRGLYVFEILTLERNADYFIEKLMPEPPDYLEFLKNLGRAMGTQDARNLERHLRGEVAQRMTQYGKFVGPVKREDRLGVIVDNRVTRLSRWSFEYEDLNGATQQDCLSFVLLRKGWCVLDFGCDEEPWMLTYEPEPELAPAVETDGDVVSTPELPVSDQVSQ